MSRIKRECLPLNCEMPVDTVHMTEQLCKKSAADNVFLLITKNALCMICDDLDCQSSNGIFKIR
jgi:hypothetical protein